LICSRESLAASGEECDGSRAHHKKVVPYGSVGDALRTLVDLHVLTEPSGTRGHHAFDDPMFREWFTKATSF
jgi:hypothetical protein